MPKQPQWQPISQLPFMTQHIDGWLDSLVEQYETLFPAKARPHALDDYTVNRVKKVAIDAQEDTALFDEQLARWLKGTLSAQQRAEVERLQGQMKKIDEQLAATLALADELAKGTIERVMAKSDVELGLEFLLNPDKVRREG